MRKPKSRRTWRKLIIVGLVIAGLGVFIWYHLLRVVPPEKFDDIVEHWKYASIGTDEPSGIPYWIWMVMPSMFPEKLPGPGGYLSLGVTWEEGRELPIGYSKQTIGFERIGMNCASCHTATVRRSASDAPMIYHAGPGRFDSQAYLRFFIACAEDPRFNGRNVLNAILEVYDMPFIDRLLYRFLIIPAAKSTLIEQKEAYGWMDRRPRWGPGRTDMNPFQIMVMKLEDNGSIGSTDMMALWNQGAHEGFMRHSDGLNTTVVEAVRSAALAAGATPESVDIESLNRLEPWLEDLPPPRYPFEIDGALAAAGEPIFREHCGTCHAFGGARIGQVIPASVVGTDRNRTDHWPQSAADAFNDFAEDYDWDFDHFTSSDGYVALPLDGVWLRAPYLHNGSVPTLADLLSAPELRPTVFYRGYDVYDPVNVGFVSQGEEAEKFWYRYDTSEVGNDNGGHTFGTDLSAEEKTALIEYLKTR